MGKIVVSDNVSLDGVIQDPAGDEGFRVGGWIGLIKDHPQLNQLALDEALAAEALCFWVAGATRGSPRGGLLGVGRWRTG
jgi:hypothetical protein